MHLDSRKVEIFIHRRLPELLFDLSLENVEFVLHVPVDVGEPLLGRVVISVLPLFVGECRYHTIVELFDLGSRVFTAFICWGTFRSDFAHPHILQLLLGR